MKRGCQECPDGTDCDTCSASTPGQFCKDNGGTGVLEPSSKCPLCQKYNYLGEATGTGSHPKVPEICLDTVVNGIYTQYYVEGCKSSGSINEYECEDTDSNGQTDKCVSKPVTCGSTESCFTQNYEIDLGTGGGKKTINFGYCGDSPLPKSEPNTLPAPCGGLPVCGSVCAGQCVPGEPPYKYNPGCAKVADCTRCGCPPSTYPGATISCNAGTGYCGYAAPPGLPGEPPDCPTVSPESSSFNKTYTITTLYLLSGNNVGSFSGFNWTGSSWRADNSIRSAASTPSNSAPAVFFTNSNTYMISGSGDGTFFGYNWTGSSWSDYPAIASGLTGIGDDSKPSIFYMAGNWNMIAGRAFGDFAGFTYTGSLWVSNSSLIAGLPDTGDNSAPSVFYKEGTIYLVSGEKTGIFYGFNWTGNSWQADAGIIAGLTSTAEYSSPYAFYYNASDLELVAGTKNDNVYQVSFDNQLLLLNQEAHSITPSFPPHRLSEACS